MTSEQFYELLGDIDETYIRKAENHPGRKILPWPRWAVIAACLVLVFAGALMTRSRNVALDLDPITIPALNDGAMGFEGYLCYDISDLTNGNPWSEDMELTTLPVYRNSAFDPSGAGVPTGLSEAEMQELLDNTASAFGLTVLSEEVIVEEHPTRIQAVTDQGTLSVQANGSIGYILPEGSLELPADPVLLRTNAAVISLLSDTYGAALGFEEPTGFSTWSYSFSGEFTRRYHMYDAAGDALADLLNYNFHSVTFFPGEQGYLSGIQINNGLLLAEKLGDYPVISVKEATKLLKNGHYQTSVPTPFPGVAQIVMVELIYRTGSLEEVLLPYYRFYVQLPDEVSGSENGLKTYGAYYVPAIAADYITNMPSYDGHFN